MIFDEALDLEAYAPGVFASIEPVLILGGKRNNINAKCYLVVSCSGARRLVRIGESSSSSSSSSSRY